MNQKIFGIETTEINIKKYKEVVSRFGIDESRPIPMLPYGPQNMVGREIRYYFFDLARGGKDGYLSQSPELRTVTE